MWLGRGEDVEGRSTNSEMADVKRARTDARAEHQHPQHALEEMLRARKLEVGAVKWVCACMLMRGAGLGLFALR